MGVGLGIPLCELDIVIPAVRRAAETIPLRDDIEEDEQALFDADFNAELRLNVVEYPVGQLNKGDLVHMAELDESVGNAHQEVHRPLRACRVLDGHIDCGCVVVNYSGRSRKLFVGARQCGELSGEPLLVL